MAQPEKTAWIDFREVKQAVSIVDILQHYGLLDGLTRKGEDKLVGRCPIHKGKSTTAFQVSPKKNAWYCFGRCKGGGNQLEFVAKMEGTDIRGAALLISQWFHLDREAEQPVTHVHDPSPGANTGSQKTGYIQRLKKELQALLDDGDQDAVVRFFVEKVMESYRNGIEAGRRST